MTATVGTGRTRTQATKTRKRGPERATEPSEDEIRIHAYHLYQRRLAAGLTGDEASDWVEAERQLLAKDLA
jgi:Protein of unknown function (DUF2934)